MENRWLVGIAYITQEPSLVPCDWRSGVGAQGREAPEGGDSYVVMRDSLWTTEANARS